jgi:uncharacterized protein (TIGR02145 family)
MKKVRLILSLSFAATMLLTSCGGFIKEVKIGNQVWMAENLNVDKFRNGDPIPEAKTAEEWGNARANKQAWCYYDNDPANGTKYGKLYNWYAVNDPRGIAPEGWHLPSDAEWTTLTDFLGGRSVAGGKMKTTGTTQWEEPNTGATNSSGFSGLPGGCRYGDGSFGYIGYNGFWWSSSEGSPNNAWERTLNYNYSYVNRDYGYKESGFSVRCLRD